MNSVGITGISGFLGSHLKPALQESGYDAFAISRPFRRSVAQMQALLEERKPDAIIHLSGIVDVRYCSEHPVEAFDSHVTETANILEAVRLVAPQMPVIYVASDKSFGEQEHCGLQTPYRPSFPYETSKSCEDMLVETYAKSYSMPAYLLRFPNFFGEADQHVERLIPGICISAARGKELVIRTRLDGTVRQYIYVRDAVDVIVRAVGRALKREGGWPKNHFGPPHLKTVGEVIRDVEAVSGRKINVKVLNLPGEVSRLSLKDENDFGFKYADWLPALERTARWYQDNYK